MMAPWSSISALKHSDVPLPALLGLDGKPPAGGSRDKFFFASPTISHRLGVLNKMVGGRSLVIVVVGERGSGKTTLMNQFIADASNRWQVCRIRIKPRRKISASLWRNLNNRLVFLSRKDSTPSVIVDDAHQLTSLELKVLLQSAFAADGTRRLQSIVLFAEPQMRERFAEIAACLPPQSVIDTIFTAPLTEAQTAAYLTHRVRTAGFLKKIPFSSDQIRAIHRISKGLPGWINGEAFLELKRLCGGRRLGPSAFLRMIRQPLLPRFKFMDKLQAMARH